MSDSSSPSSAPSSAVSAKRVSANAISRVLALQDAELSAARLISPQTYPDFFSDYVEAGGGGGGGWHEMFQDVIIGHPHPFEEFPEFGPTRMVPIDALHLGKDQSYSDFFVEGGGGNWHEAVAGETEDARVLAVSMTARTNALAKSNVLRAYSMLKAGGFAK